VSRTKKEAEVSPRELLKYEIARELGLWDKIEQYGWAELTAEESGRLGGVLARRLKERREAP